MKKKSTKWPEVWPGYETVGKLGRGGYGTVWKVRKVDPSGEYYSAVKKISIPSGEEEYAALSESGYGEEEITTIFKSRLDKIEAEFKLMEEFQGHSNIVSYQEHMEIEHEDGVGWDILIRMELLEPLGKCYDRFSEKEVIKLGIHMCTALETIQRQHIIHRDIKPSNILYNEKLGYYKLADFGIAKTMDHVTKGTMIGTADYIAPEVFNKEAYGFQADQYSLGLVLYWMLNKRRLPFIPLDHVPTDDEIQAAKQKRVNGVALPEPLHGSDRLKAVVLKACAYDPADRYPDISSMKRDLHACEAQADDTLFHDLNSTSVAENTQRENRSEAFSSVNPDDDADETIGNAFSGRNHAHPNEGADFIGDSKLGRGEKNPAHGDVFDHYDDDDEETMGTMGRFGKRKTGPETEPMPENCDKESKNAAEAQQASLKPEKNKETINADADSSIMSEPVKDRNKIRAEHKTASTRSSSKGSSKLIFIGVAAVAILAVVAVLGLGGKSKTSTTASTAAKSEITTTAANPAQKDDQSLSSHDNDIMSHDEYVAAEYDSIVSIESYVQGKTKLINGRANFFLQSEDGAYFIYELQCSEDEYHQLSEGQKLRVSGTKTIWNGETEITDASFEILDGTYIATSQDLTNLMSEFHTSEMATHQNERFTFKEIEVVWPLDFSNTVWYGADGSGNRGDDLYFMASFYNWMYQFVVNTEMYDETTELYQLCESLRMGDIINIEGFLYWYDYGDYQEPNPWITSIEVVSRASQQSIGLSFLGSLPDEVSNEGVIFGLYIQEVSAGSKAESAGFKSGDIIIDMNGHDIYNIYVMRSYAPEIGSGESVDFIVLRKNTTGEYEKVPITVIY